MYIIHKLRANHVIDFAAEELKKYLRMMMPRCGEIDICYTPEAKDGFRLGLAEDFGLSFPEATDCELDDVVHIETDEQGGILTGSNPRSVLFAVYRYLKENGCRFLYPGVDGEYIPLKPVAPISYHHMADYRFRGECNEGTEFQQCMLETIDFYPKQELNTYMLEFDIPFGYYDYYYSHLHNDKNRPPEPVSKELILQWKRQCEAEIAKRGLQFHDMGHGWTAEPFGISSTTGWQAKDAYLPEESRRHLAMIKGKREFFGGIPVNSNLCMSNPETRAILVKAVADYAQIHTNVSYVHVWLADATRNHCECEECQKKRPSDYYVQMMNELDEELTRRNLSSRIVFIAYVDTLFAPVSEKIRNPERFALLYAPIHRSYTGSIHMDQIKPAREYVRNDWVTPVSAEENAAHLLEWQKSWAGPCICYEYHFWKHMTYDPGMMSLSRRIYEDLVSIKNVGLAGMIEDGSQRAFFPNGLAVYMYAATLLDCSCDYEAVKNDYLQHVYGEAWQEVADYLTRISETFDFAFMEGETSVDPQKGRYYNPEHVKQLEQIKELTAYGRELARKHFSMPTRAQTVSMRLLYRHAEYCDRMAEMMIQMALGNAQEAYELWDRFRHEYGVYEFEMERYYDHGFAMKALKYMFAGLSVF